MMLDITDIVYSKVVLYYIYKLGIATIFFLISSLYFCF